MSVATYVNTRTHSIVHVTDNILGSLKLIIFLVGLDTGKILQDWATLELGIKTWLSSGHLEAVYLEISTKAGAPVGRWDFDICYTEGGGDGSLWIDPDAIRHAIKKVVIDPKQCEYRIITSTSYGRPDVSGWGPATLLSTKGFEKHSIGTTVNGGAINAQAAYWRKR